jgi:phosphohistidine phosphatase SixA
MRLKSNLLQILPSIIVLAIGTTACAQNFEGAALVHALERGGYVLVMRHASSPSEPPAKESADVENTRDERQLDEKGRTTSTAMGNALHQLKIPVGQVLSSPTYRALETAKYAQLGTARTYPELGDDGKSMQGGTEAQAHWLQNKVREFPSVTNTFIVTHSPNITAAFPQIGSPVADGEALVFGPDGTGGATIVARIKIEEWPSLRP